MVEAGEGAAAVLRRAYKLQDWVALTVLADAICSANNRSICHNENSKVVWNLKAGPSRQFPADACEHGSLPAEDTNYICIPDVTIVSNFTYITRRFEGEEGFDTPEVVTSRTRGCETFDTVCEIRILSANPRQENAWHVAILSGLLARSEQPATQAETSNIAPAVKWWGALSGTVTLPALSLVTTVAPSDAGETPKNFCAELNAAVTAGHEEVRKRNPTRPPASGDTGLIETNCNELLSITAAPPDKAQSFVSMATITDSTRDALLKRWRAEMHWDNSAADGQTMIGIWDGDVKTDEPTFTRDNYPAPVLKSTSVRFENQFLANNVVTWLDPFPAGQPPAGPCGAAVPYPPLEHATLVAAMIAGQSEGLLPDSRLWVHVWDERRLATLGPAASLAWFYTSVADAETLFHTLYNPVIANLSCAPGASGSTAPVDVLEKALLPLASNGQHADLVPYLVAVAAGNRELKDEEPLVADGRAIGYAGLGRKPSTAGFISVVGLGSDGKSVLKCGDVQALLSSATQMLPAVNGIADFCPVKPSGAEGEAKQPLVLYGTPFDVAAIGLGVGPEVDNGSAVVMWGSSFASPYVAALAASIARKTRGDYLPYNEATAALIADRIRLTADHLDDDIARYGRINAKRALDFENDRFEMRPPPADSADYTGDELWVNACERSGGRVALDREREGTSALPINGGTQISLDKVLRLRRIDTTGTYQGIARRADDMLTIYQINDNGSTVPIRCIPSDQRKMENSRVRISLQSIESFTRCSFIMGCQ